MSLKSLSVVGMMAIGVVACVTTNATRLGGGPIRPKVEPQDVLIYRSAEQVPGRYEEIAILCEQSTRSGGRAGKLHRRIDP